MTGFYSFIPLSTIDHHMAEIKQQGVSEKARSPSQFLDHYRSVHGLGSSLTLIWTRRRNAFLNRTMAAFKKNPTRRRWLSMIVWAYQARPVPQGS